MTHIAAPEHPRSYHGRKKFSPGRVYCFFNFALGASINHKNTSTLDVFKEPSNYVDGTTRTAFEVVQFLNYFVTKLLAERREIPRTDESFLYGVFTILTRAR
jgi:hypothetical protein